jgi:ATP-dependent helicase Lhr and Lhr-like helicase
VSVSLPPDFAAWFSARGWRLFPHQTALLDAAAGKTLAGFLPSLIDLSQNAHKGLHTLYISPLRALAIDVQRNVMTPIEEMKLPVRAESRTGDTSSAMRTRQRRKPPQILMTTPESLALLLSYPEAPQIFSGLKTLIVDEVHALAPTKRGDLLALDLARLGTLAPGCRRIGLSATVAEPEALTRWLSSGSGQPMEIVRGAEGLPPDVRIMLPGADLPWSGRMGLMALPEIYEEIRTARSVIVFVNTRAQAELIFQGLWHLNIDKLPIALHHGSLAPDHRKKVEAAMARGDLRATVATSSLDLGIDWGDVDLVLQVGAPKGVSRLLQRIGRANHRHDRASRAILVPANRFEVLECRAALDAMQAGERDDGTARVGALDVLAQHVIGTACSAPFDAEALFAEVRRAAPYDALTRAEFQEVLDFASTGGYALRTYDRFRKLRQQPDGRWRISNGMVVRQYRLNIGTIVDAPMMRVVIGRRVLGTIEESFVSGLNPGDTIMFAGRMLAFVGIRENDVLVTPARGKHGDPRVSIYAGARMPLTTNLARRVEAMLARRDTWANLPEPVQEWLEQQRKRSVMPPKKGVLVETFPRSGRHYLVCYAFEGRNAHQTLGMLLTRRMERRGLKPLGFVATDYVIAIWSLEPAHNLDDLFAEDMLGDDLEEWMAESSLLRRSFRNVAVVAGLIERRHPGQEKNARQVSFSADLIFDVLRQHEPNHLLLRATRAEAADTLADAGRLADFLKRIKGHIRHKALDRISPFAIPALVGLGQVSVSGEALDSALEERAAELVAEAGLA